MSFLITLNKNEKKYLLYNRNGFIGADTYENAEIELAKVSILMDKEVLSILIVSDKQLDEILESQEFQNMIEVNTNIPDVSYTGFEIIDEWLIEKEIIIDSIKNKMIKKVSVYQFYMMQQRHYIPSMIEMFTDIQNAYALFLSNANNRFIVKIYEYALDMAHLFETRNGRKYSSEEIKARIALQLHKKMNVTDKSEQIWINENSFNGNVNGILCGYKSEKGQLVTVIIPPENFYVYALSDNDRDKNMVVNNIVLSIMKSIVKEEMNLFIFCSKLFDEKEFN